MLLRDSPYKGTLTWTGLDEMTRGIELLKAFRLHEQQQAQQQPQDPQVDELRRQFPDLLKAPRDEYDRRIEFRELIARAAALSARP